DVKRTDLGRDVGERTHDDAPLRSTNPAAPAKDDLDGPIVPAFAPAAWIPQAIGGVSDSGPTGDDDSDVLPKYDIYPRRQAWGAPGNQGFRPSRRESVTPRFIELQAPDLGQPWDAPAGLRGSHIMTSVDPGAIVECAARTQGVPICGHMGAT